MKMLNINYALATALIILSATVASNSFAETAIIVHPSNSAATSPTNMKRIFLGKVTTFAGGGTATPIELAEGNATRSTFNNDFLGKTDAQMKSYWGRLVFTGKATAPQQAESDAAMIESIANDPELIGYIDAAKVTSAVVVVHTF